MKKSLVYIVAILLITNCSLFQKTYTYGVCVRDKSDTTRIAQDTVLGLMDTTKSKLSVLPIDKTTDDTMKVCYIILDLSDTTNSLRTVLYQDESGFHRRWVEPGTYFFGVRCSMSFDFNEKITLKPGEIREIHMSVATGGGGITDYIIETDHELSDEEYRKMVEDLSKQEW